MGYLPDVSQISVASPRAEEGMPSEAFAWDEFWSNFPDEKFDPIDQKCFWLIYRYNYTIKEASNALGCRFQPSLTRYRASWESAASYWKRRNHEKKSHS
jgi:hypothetical protein